MKKNYRFRFLALAAILLLGLFAVSCHKDDDEITEEQARIVMANAEVVMDNVSQIYEASATIEEMAQHLDEIKAMANVEDAWQGDIAICVKIKDGGVIMYPYYPEYESDSIDIDEFTKRINSETSLNKEGALCEERSLCILNVLHDSEGNMNELMSQIERLFHNQLGYKTRIINSEDVTPKVFVDTMPLYGFTIINSHGFYENELHWILTGMSEKTSIIEMKDYFQEWKRDYTRYICSTTHNYQVAISEEFLNKYIDRRFPKNSIVYANICSTLKDNDNLWKILEKKGLGCFIGYNKNVWVFAELYLAKFVNAMMEGNTTGVAVTKVTRDIVDWIRGLRLLCCPANSNITLVEPGDIAELKDYISFPSGTRTVIFEYNSSVNSGDRLESYGSEVPIYGNLNGTVYTISTSSSQIYAPSNCRIFLLNNTENIEEIDFGVGFNTSNVTVLAGMFDECSSLTSLNLSGWNTENVTDMSSMFWGCSSLTSLNLSGWNTENVTDMSSMFKGCSRLTSLNLSGWNTENVTDMSMMFDECSSLTSLNLSGWNTENVTDMSMMFWGCSSLTSLNLSGWNNENVTDMSSMFWGCSSLTSLNLSGWNTENVTTMETMFRGCSSLTSLNLSEWNTENVRYMQNMFYGCSSLTSLNLSGWNTSRVYNMIGMFYDCSNLTSLNIANFNIRSDCALSDMCNNLAATSHVCTITCTSNTRSRLTDESWYWNDTYLNENYIIWNIVGKKK